MEYIVLNCSVQHNIGVSDILPSPGDFLRFAVQPLVEVKAVDLATVSALPTTTLGTSAVLAQQVQVVAAKAEQMSS